jgi:hypothetical protein
MSHESIGPSRASPRPARRPTAWAPTAGCAPCARLDVGGDGVTYASMTTSGINHLYTMNLSTGAATLLGEIDVVASIQSIAISE